MKFAPLSLSNLACTPDCYKALIEHLCNHLSHLVLCHHCKGIPCEMVGHYKDIFHHRGLIQLHRGLYAGVIKMHQLMRGICLNQTEGSPWHLCLKRLAAWASPYYGSAILSHHGPPGPLLSESQGLLLALMAGITMYPIKCHAALTHSNNEG